VLWLPYFTTNPYTNTSTHTSLLLSNYKQALDQREVDCVDIHEAVSKSHIGCAQFFTSRHDAVTANFKQTTPFHLIDHRTAPVCHELTSTLLAALSTEAATTLVNTADARGNTALHSTASYELRYDGPVKYRDVDQLTVCHTCMRALLAAGADPTVNNRAGVQAVTIPTVLTVTFRNNSNQGPIAAAECTTTVKALQQAGLNINTTRYEQHTEYNLHNAAGNDSTYYNEGAVRLLLDCGADVMLHDADGWTAMQCAAYYDAHRSVGDGSGSNADIIQMLYDAGGDELLEGTTASGLTLLHLAESWPGSIQKLCELGADVEDQTPLHYASAYGGSECVRVLLDKGANLHAYGGAVSWCEGTGGWQSVHYAAVVDTDIDTIDTLLAAGATIDVPTTTGCTAAWLVARYGAASTAAELLEQLFSRGADVMHYSDEHGSLLQAAAGNGDVDVIKTLLDKGLTLSSTDKTYCTSRRQTPLHCAAQGGHTAMVQLLIDHGCDVTDIDTDGNTALRLCLQGPIDDAACFTILLKAGADVLDITTDTR
jgi:ankyrin repeat protein